jgi:hypothetical protein
VYGAAELNLLKSVLVETGIGGFNASDVRTGTITNVFENILILLLKGKIENYKKRAYTAEIRDRIALIFVSATMAVIY